MGALCKYVQVCIQTELLFVSFHAVYGDEKTGRPNLEVWRAEERVAEYIQKKTQSWYVEQKREREGESLTLSL